MVRVSAPPSAGQTVRNDTTYTYFDNGWTKSSVDPWDITTTYDYNLLGQQTARSVTSAGGSSARTMSWDYFPDGKLKSRSDDGVPVGAHVVLVDNSDAQNVSAVGTWLSSTVGSGFEGFDYQTHAAGTGLNAFTWNLTIPQDGTYQVFVRYPAAAATNAPYTVTTTTGTTTVPVNQTTGEGSWVSLGSYAFTVSGVGQAVSLSDNANGAVAADAVKLVRDNSADVDNENTAFTYDYDPNGNMVGIGDTSPGTAVDQYAVTYTGLDQVQKIEEKLAGVVKHTTSYTYDENGQPLTRTHDAAVDTYAYGVRNLVASVTNAASVSDPTPKVTTFTYTARSQVFHEVKGNGNTVDYTYFLNRALQHQIEKKPDGTTVVAEHTYDYDPDGNQTLDDSRVQNADNHAAYINRTAASTYDPRDRLATVTKTDGGSTVDSESYIHDPNNNVVTQTINGTTTDYTYNRNRLVQATAGGATSSYNYDPFGRLDNITSGGQQLQHNFYDGFDRITKVQRLNGQTFYSYDPLDRTTQRFTFHGIGSSKQTDFTYIGLSNQLSNEITDGLDGQVLKSYQYSPTGQRLSQTVQNLDGSVEDGYYGYNAHTDVEDVTTSTGDTKATYGYTAYGSNDPTAFTGIDPPNPEDSFDTPYNAYRFNAKRFDPETGSYDMGFRDYSPGLNQFLTRDNYNGALADSGLTTNPYTGNRYAYGAGNPYTNIELDGHEPCPDLSNCDYLYTGDKSKDTRTNTRPTCPDGGVGCQQGEFERARDYIIEQIKTNLKSDEFKEIHTNLMPMNSCNRVDGPSDALNCADSSKAVSFLAALKLFKAQVCTGCAWDQKEALRRILNIEPQEKGQISYGGADHYLPVPGERGISLSYDIWSNIHYGFIGRAAGFDGEDLQKAADLGREYPSLEPVFGKNYPGDVISVQIGIDLYDKYGVDGLTPERLQEAIINAVPQYQSVYNPSQNEVTINYTN